MGFENPSISESVSLKKSKVLSAIIEVVKMLKKEVETTLPLSFSELKKRKKAVSIP